MAIRAAGELRAPAALPILRAWAGSTEPFVAEYAAAAAEAIDGRPAAPRARAAWVDRDVWLLPDRVRAVLCVAPVRAGGAAVPIDQALPFVGAKEEDRLARDALLAEVLGVAEQFGNFRFDGMTWGLSGDIGERSGYVVGILRGRYDRDAAIRALEGRKVPSTTVGPAQVFRLSQEAAVFFPSADRIVFVASPRGGELPLKELAAAVADNGGGLRAEQDMVRLVQSVNTSQPLWAVAKLTDAYRQLPPLAGLDRVTIVASSGKAGGDAYDVKLSAGGSDPEKVRQSAEAVNALVTELRRTVLERGDGDGPAGAGKPSPAIASAEAFLKAFTLRAAETNATAEASLNVSRADLLNLLIRSVHREGAEDPAAEPAPATTAPATRETSPRAAPGR
jgi:hypothetical protein